jgi:hypothetical protein
MDIHKKVLMVVVASAASEVEDPTGEALEFECRRLGTGNSERAQLVSWLQQRGVTEVVMESTAQYWKPIWLELEPLFRSCIWRKRIPIARPRDARTTFATPNGWRGACWPAS